MQSTPLGDAALQNWLEILIYFHVNSGFDPSFAPCLPIAWVFA